MVCEVKKFLGYDDTLDVFGIHGIGGIFGAIMTGIFATSAVNPIFKSESGNILPVGLIEGNSAQVINQLVGIGIALAVVGTFVILKVVDVVIGLRVTESEETVGLDVTQHGETAYVFEGDLIHISGANAVRQTETVHKELIPSQLAFETD